MRHGEPSGVSRRVRRTAMTITVSKQDVHSRWDELLSLAHGGTEVIVRGEGGHAVKLVPIVPEPPRREWKFNLHPGAWTVRDDFDDPIDEEDFLKGNI
jgi:antitoxin (DNA-binding transcriptional repressor) of toxin-antitoxin stability system